jgi:hypothetical protein
VSSAAGGGPFVQPGFDAYKQFVGLLAALDVVNEVAQVACDSEAVGIVAAVPAL